MKKTKFEEKIKNACQELFNDEILSENKMEFAGNYLPPTVTPKEPLTGKANLVIKFLKQAFLFLPGAFVLFFLSVGASCLLVSKSSPAIGPILNLRVFAFLAVTVFMTWFGLGDLRKPKHLIIPGSIILIGSIIGSLSGIFGGLQAMYFLADYAVYFFPLALIIPFLAKCWIDEFDKN